MSEPRDSASDAKQTTGQYEDKAAKEMGGALKLDQHGFPLRPQPSDDPFGTEQADQAQDLQN